MNHIVLFSEAQDEAAHLSRVTRRSVEVVPRDCDCQFDPMCGKCDRGTQYTFVYSFCSHPVNEDGEDTKECLDNFCREQEHVKAELDLEETFARVSAPLKSCREVASEQSEEAA